jgi:hypothetical protein
MRKTLGIVMVACAALLITQASHAAIFLFESNMIGLNEVPPNPSPGTGIAQYSFDDTTNTLSMTFGSYTGLLSPASVSHVHMAPAGVNGPVIIPIANTGGTTGTLSMVATVLTAPQVTALFTGGLYTNVHSQAFPGGEIRDQLHLVPGPAALALLGIAGLAARGRRRTPA